jgi:hypothetical protein
VILLFLDVNIFKVPAMHWLNVMHTQYLLLIQLLIKRDFSVKMYTKQEPLNFVPSLMDKPLVMLLKHVLIMLHQFQQIFVKQEEIKLQD